jgi:hypothetical protein
VNSCRVADHITFFPFDYDTEPVMVYANDPDFAA